ncbi:MAG: AsmA family protein [Verrucomicrobia bacterium]|nr:AsmA family protein [Verrucomicrobiota bacterium]
MSETTPGLKIAKRSSWGRKLAFIFGGLLLLLILFYFVATSAAFFKGVILPRVSKVMHADITVADASISPFSQVTLRGLKVQTTGTEPLVKAEEVRVRYSLGAILGGNIAVQEVTVVSPVVEIVENADGTSNLDPFTKPQKGTKEKKAPSEKKPGKPLNLNLKNVALKNATVRLTKNLKGGDKQVTELSGINIAADGLKNGATAKLSLDAIVKLDHPAAAPTTGRDQLAASLKSSFNIALDANLNPTTVQGDAKLAVSQALGAFKDLAALTGSLDCDLSPTEIKKCALTFSQSGKNLGSIAASGPLDLAKREGKIKIEVSSIDRQVLNLAGTAMGMDFNSTVLNSSNQIELSKNGQLIAVNGQLTGSSFSVTQKKQTTPAVDLLIAYNLTVDQASKTALVQSFTLDGKQQQRPLLQGALSKPMKLDWGNTNNTVDESAFDLTLTDLNLADWRAFVGEFVSAGKVNAKVNLLSQQAGKKLKLDVTSQINGLSATFGSNKIDQADVTVAVRGTVDDFSKVQLAEYSLQLAHQKQSTLAVTGNGTYDAKSQDADLQAKLETALPQLVSVVVLPDFKATAGTVKFTGHITQKNLTPTETKKPSFDQTVVGNLQLENFTGNYGSYKFAEFATAADVDVEMKGQQLQIRKTAGSLREGAKPGGSFDVSGNYNLDKKSGQFALKLVDLNQDGLRPFLESALGDKKLVSVSINATASANFDDQGDSAVKADLQMTKLVVSDPNNQLPTTPLEAKLQVDTSLRKQVLDLRQCQVTLSPTSRAKNELQLKGQVDMSKTNATQGSVKLLAESLDVTSYYDLFADKSKAAETKPPKASTKTASKLGPAETGETEPAAMNLPFKNFTAEVNIGRFYLREVDIANWQTTVKLDGGRVLLKPFQLTLNGAPVNANADLNLGVPGYQYDVALNADKIPLPPFVNSFQPERKGQIGGVLIASANVKGAGVTGASLQKNLSGQFNVLSTNLNLSLINVKSKLIKSIINVVVSIPNMISHPGEALGNVFEQIIGTSKKENAGWVDQLTSAPINVVVMRGSASNGRVDVQEAVVRSDAFEAKAHGDITLAPVLTNSTLKMPVSISLNRALGDKIGLVNANAPTNQVYFPMPDFLTMQGTIGNPDPQRNYAALAGLAAKAVGGALTGSKAGGILSGVGGLLTGEGLTNTNKASTNQPSLLDSLDIFKKPKKKK